MLPRRSKRIINVNVLPGEPTDGRGRVCIHLFVPDQKGSFAEPHALQPGTENKKVIAGPKRGRLACDPKRRPSAKPDKNNVVTITPRSDDPRAVTCPRCKKTKEYEAMMARLELKE